MSPEVVIKPIGNVGNQMLQVMLAQELIRRVPGLVVGGYGLPDWGLKARDKPRPLPKRRILLTGQYLDVDLISGLLRSGRIKQLEIAALGFKMAHYGPPSAYQSMFPRQPIDVPLDLRDALLINVRGAEILADTHLDYGPIPVDFYRRLARDTGLRPVFMGQVGLDAYSLSLRQAFPEAIVLESRGPMYDFQLMRSARHLVTSVSTFSWLAAWLSDAKTIHMPVLGMLNPAQRADIDLLPIDDLRYRFYRFPVRHWMGSEQQFHELAGPCQAVPSTVQEMRQLLGEARQSLTIDIQKYRRRLQLHAWLHSVFGTGACIGLRPR